MLIWQKKVPACWVCCQMPKNVKNASIIFCKWFGFCLPAQICLPTLGWWLGGPFGPAQTASLLGTMYITERQWPSFWHPWLHLLSTSEGFTWPALASQVSGLFGDCLEVSKVRPTPYKDTVQILKALSLINFRKDCLYTFRYLFWQISKILEDSVDVFYGCQTL